MIYFGAENGVNIGATAMFSGLAADWLLVRLGLVGEKPPTDI